MKEKMTLMGYLCGLTFDVKRSCRWCVRCHHSLAWDICRAKRYSQVDLKTAIHWKKAHQMRKYRVIPIFKENQNSSKSPFSVWINTVLIPNSELEQLGLFFIYIFKNVFKITRANPVAQTQPFYLSGRPATSPVEANNCPPAPST